MFSLIPPQYAMLAKFVFALGLFASGAYSGWYVTSDHCQIKQDALQLSRDVAVKAQLTSNQQALQSHLKLVQKAQVNHEKNQVTVSDAYAAFNSVRVTIPTVDCGSMPGNSEAGTNSDRSAGVLSESINKYFAEAQGEAGKLSERCDRLNIDAIRANETLK